jgi:hypothetical protein
MIEMSEDSSVQSLAVAWTVEVQFAESEGIFLFATDFELA